MMLILAGCGGNGTGANVGANAPTDHLSLGERFLTELEYEQALFHFLALIEIEPMNAQGYIGAAQAHLGLGQIDDAIAVLLKALELLPDDIQLREAFDTVIRTAYSEILNAYQELVDNNFFLNMVDQADRLEEWASAPNIMLNMFLEMDIEAFRRTGQNDVVIYYAFFDVDGNGIPELFIGSRGIMHVFTWHNGQIYDLFQTGSFGERVNVSVRENGIFSVFGTDGWDMYRYDFYRISHDMNSLLLVETVSRRDFGETYFRGPWGEDEEISSYEFAEIVRRFTGYEPASWSAGIQLDWQPFIHFAFVTPEIVHEGGELSVYISDDWETWFDVSYGEWFRYSVPEFIGGYRGGSMYSNPIEEGMLLFSGAFSPQAPSQYPVGISLPVSRVFGSQSTSVAELRYLFGDAFSMYDIDDGWLGFLDMDEFRGIFYLTSENDNSIEWIHLGRQNH